MEMDCALFPEHKADKHKLTHQAHECPLKLCCVHYSTESNIGDEAGSDRLPLYRPNQISGTVQILIERETEYL
jgi:hypothetical protein